jgi:hypothetical protein
MKLNTILHRFVLLFASIVISLANANAQDKNDKKEEEKASVREIIESKNFTFIARSATPMSGRFINLNTLYDVRVFGDTVLSDLPYYGRAFTAPVNPAESALRFTSTRFDYKIKERKKNGWEITISPKDGKDVRQMYMTVYENGTAFLQILSNNRQPISFNGYVTARSKK